jgi:Holliday junction resolvasome RuvABC DNA-binding subunit
LVRKLEDITQGNADFIFTAKGVGDKNNEKWTLEIATKVKRLTLKDIEIS